jgi:predicted ATPase
MDDRPTTPAQVTETGRFPTLRAGTRFGRYDIVAPLGTGGMGEVYRARDTRLGRDLAIKILSHRLSAGKLDLKRFEREACSASALNHPNIVTIFELGEIDSTYYIAMELVEGELLRDLLGGDPIPLRKVILMGAQTADGLAKAHEAGVIHRDLKPENLMVSRDGYVKILDFGLVKLVAPGGGLLAETSDDDSQTTAGTILGTIEYMSPEQARGATLDFHSDQFSFGSVLYEMVTGKRTFRRGSKTETLAAILRDEPEPVASLNPQAPAPLCWLIERCLAKNPKDRYASTRDLARDLASIRERLSEAPARNAPVRSHNLPPQRTVFVGRDLEIGAVKELVLRRDVRLVTLTGPGGIGKTRLAVRVAGDAAEWFPGGVCFIPLAAVSDPALLPSIIGQALGMRETGGQVTIESLIEHLHDLRQDLLLVIDNFEHLHPAAQTVAELISSAEELKVLVTSRSPLHIYGEREFPVPPLGLPDLGATISVRALARKPAVALFLERAVAVKPNFELTEENALAVATICNRLDGLPLAIELAAARIKLLSPSAMQTRLESRLQLLTGGAKDLPVRQQTLRGAIDWSYGLLNPAEQALFRRLSVFVGGCTLEGVEAVCNTKQDLEIDVVDGMESLVNKSLVQRIDCREGESRFVLLETVREYGLERLASSGEQPATRNAHAAYCLVLAEEYAAQAADPARTDWLALCDADHDNFRAALEWLTQAGNADWGLRLGAALFHFWDAREHLTEGRDRLAKILKVGGDEGSSNARTRALFAAGVLAGEQGDYRGAESLLRESMGLSRVLNDTRGVGIALNALAVNARDLGDLAASRSLFEKSMEIWKSLGDSVVMARSLSNLASVVKLQGDYATARSLFEGSLALFEELGDSTGMAWSLNYEGDVAHEQGEHAVARSLYEQSLTLFRELGDKWGMAGCLVDLGNLARDQGDHHLARSHYADGLRLFQELGQKRGVARLLDCLACSAALESAPQRALRLAGAAAAMRRVLGAPLRLADQARLEKTLDLARQSLSPAEAAAAWMDGWTTPSDQAVREAFEQA